MAGSMASSVPCLTLHLPRQRAERCFRGCLALKLTACSATPPPSAVNQGYHLGSLLKKQEQPPGAFPHISTWNSFSHPPRVRAKRESDKSCHVPPQSSFPAFQQEATSYKQESEQLYSTLILGVAKPRAVVWQPSKICKE